MTETYNRERELNEALMAGEDVLRALYTAQKELNSSANWGLFDMFAGGMLSTMIKHGHMGNAERALSDARVAMDRYRREIADVREMPQIHIEVDGFLSFADFFFDNFFVDWMVQDKIERARQQVNDAIFQVQNIQNQLRGIPV